MTKLKKFRSSLWVSVVCVSLLGVVPGVVRACPNCAETVAEGSGDGNGTDKAETPQLAAGYNYSILYMMGSMYAVLGSLGFMGFHYFRKHSTNINDVSRDA
ncbi:MAG: hypothetical protein GC164_15700 [Phycisphaera sp.]|nr:hypothetical protein [Phycisphaera sp.]